jgi:nitrite reductase/ring-hydroxylating ferredoxin subunit
MATAPAPSRDDPSSYHHSWPNQVLGLIEDQPWLEQFNQQVTQWLDPLLKHPDAPRWLDFLHGRWLGHSLHAVLTDATIGLWSSSWILDTLRARKSAAVLNFLGSVSAVATAAAGTADWSQTNGRNRRLGLVHATANVTGLTLQLFSLFARLARRPARAYTLSTLGLGVSLAAAHIGGELVYSRGIMVNNDAFTKGPEDWTPTIAEAELQEAAPKRVEVAGRGVLLYRRGRRITAMEDSCAHAGCWLSMGKVENDVVTCICHGSQYSLVDGAVLHGPSTFPQQLLEARARSGQVEVRGRLE